MAVCTHSAPRLKAAVRDSATQSDSHPLRGSLTWKPIKLANPGTKASWSAKNHHSSRKISGPFESTSAWIEKANLKAEHYLFPSRLAKSPHVSTRQYARIVHQWVAAIGLDSTIYGTHSIRRTKATLIYKRTKNLRAVQLLLGHTKLESTVRYLGIEVDDALEISEQTEI